VKIWSRHLLNTSLKSVCLLLLQSPCWMYRLNLTKAIYIGSEEDDLRIDVDHTLSLWCYSLPLESCEVLAASHTGVTKDFQAMSSSA
jgi:hypothetical protein